MASFAPTSKPQPTQCLPMMSGIFRRNDRLQQNRHVAAWLIAARKAIAHFAVLDFTAANSIDQWRERLAAFLNLPIKDIGQIGGGRRRPSGNIDVAVIKV